LGWPPTEWPDRPTRWRRGGDRARRSELADQIDGRDVDPQLERRRRDERGQLTRLETLLGLEALLLRERSMVRGDAVLAEPLAEVARRALRQPSRVHEDEGRPVGADELREPVVDFLPDLVRHDRAQRRCGHLDREVEPADVPLVHDRAARNPVGTEPARPHEEARDLLDGLLGRGEPDAHEAVPTRAASRSSESERCEPRLSATMAWISSTITVRVVRSIARPPSLVSRM
jgi:hypothetical protein